MKFGEVALEASLGGVLAHAVRLNGLVLKKGHVIGRADLESLKAHGVERLVVSQLEPDDVGEDEAARRLAERVAGAGLRVERAFTGRSNIFAVWAGVLRIDKPAVDRINHVDEAVTLATLADLRAVEAGEMVATVKIIPFAVPAPLLEAALARAAGPVLSIAAFRPLKVGVISTMLPGLKASVIAKTLAILAARLAPAGASIVADERVAHASEALAAAIGRLATACDLVIVFGASAITDRRDVIPRAIEEAGGRVDHFGMPVDPGNLLLIGKRAGKTILGAPGCARSPKENGFDWVLQRLLAGLDVTGDDIRGMGVGGLLMEIKSRPQPRLGGGPDDEHG
jgi:molybdenum cofactor cytidylyltransferase